MVENPSRPLVIVRYSEIGLKGGNRSWFEEELARNIRERLRGRGTAHVERRRGRIFVWLEDEGAQRAALAPLADTPGVRSLSRARPVERDLVALGMAALDLARDALGHTPRPATFRIETNRSDKRFPRTSMEVDAEIGGAVLAGCPELRVDLEHPGLTISIEIQAERAYIMSEWIAGPGGLPVGSSGPVVLLLSGGIDSPVAGLLLQNRGCAIAPVYCHAFPYTGDAALEKVRDLARELARRQAVLDLRVASLTEAQVALRDHCRPELLAVLYRRLMVRIADRIAAQVGAHALATGESVGQVASQTLPNMRAIEAAVERPILRPLVAHDKEETIALARRLGTYEISIRPGDDCCQLFAPKHPATRVSLAEVLAEEAKVDLAGLLERCMASLKTARYARGERPVGAEVP